MLMMTADDFDKLADSKAKILREKIAAKLIDESEKTPIWEARGILLRLAKEIQECKD